MHPKSRHLFIELGVWTVVTNKASIITPGWLSNIGTLAKRLQEFVFAVFLLLSGTKHLLKKDESKKRVEANPATEVKMFTHLFAFMKEVYSLGPIYFYVDITMKTWDMVNGALQLYFTSLILSSITRCLEKQEIERFSLIHAVAGRVGLCVASKVLSRTGSKLSAIQKERVTYHFMMKTMRTALSFDHETSEDPEVLSKLSGDKEAMIHQRSEAWWTYRSLLDVIFGLLSIFSELSLVIGLSRTNSTFTLAIALCLIRPILTLFENYDLFGRSFVIYCNNQHFSRMASLHSLAYAEKFREDRLSNNYGSYIMKEFKHNQESLKEKCTDNPHMQWWINQPITMAVINSLSSDFSLIFFAARVLWDHSSVTLGDLILLQQTTQSVQSTSSMLLYKVRDLSGYMLTIRNIYTLSDIPNKIKDGDVPYPRIADEKSHSGAALEFQNVSFKYPGAEKGALTNLSFSIKPGQLVVIVGVNGSGKSSTVKLLTRLHDPSEGQILLDGLPLTSYRLADIRRTIAILRQDHSVLPLSLHENIALGLPERDISESELQNAILQGGADRFVKKLNHGVDTILDPIKTTMTHFVGDTDKALKSVVDEKEKKMDLSGGEMQRLAASRTFMRLMGGNIRLLAADEPTSALDPEGEFELFTRLRKHSGGKTVIFITHRFGHLTKYADLILCMKDGRLVEQGTHDELMSTYGEYKRLHDVQAQAFTSVSQ